VFSGYIFLTMKREILKDLTYYHLSKILECCNISCCTYRSTINKDWNFAMDKAIKNIIHNYLSCKCSLVCPCQKVEKVKVGKKLQSRIEEFIKEFTECCNLSCC